MQPANLETSPEGVFRPSLGSFRSVSGPPEPVAFEVYKAGVYLHGTKADLAVGEMLVPGRESNFEVGRVMKSHALIQ